MENLKPLSNLVCEIVFEDEKFIPIERLFGESYTTWDGESETSPICVKHTYNCSKGLVSPNYLPYWVVKQLIEWGFDINSKL